MYNHLNLPSKITVKKSSTANKGTIEYSYDAAGNKLKKVTTETGASVTHNGTPYTTNIVTTTLYLHGAVYESKDYIHASLGTLDQPLRLQFLQHEEGRIRWELANSNNCPATANRFVWDYFIRDYLGNVRMVLTEQNENLCYPAATVEDSRYQSEDDIYSIVNARRIDKATTGATQASFENKLYRTHGGLTNEKTGLGAVLKVMKGDKVKLTVESFYALSSGNAGTPLNLALTELLSAFAGSGLVGAKGAVTASQVSTIGNNTNQLNSFLNRTPPTNQAKAYLNWILFDEQLRYVTAGAEPVLAGGGYKLHSQFINAPVDVTRNGFLYVFVSNESNLAVFFDNLDITHTPGPVLEETHYYPYGLEMAGISGRAVNGMANAWRYQGAFSDYEELSGYNDFALRSYNAQVGRWTSADPYNEFASPYMGMGANPANYADPTGGCVWCETADKALTLANVTVMSSNAAINWALASSAKSIFNNGALGGALLERLTSNNKTGLELLQIQSPTQQFFSGFMYPNGLPTPAPEPELERLTMEEMWQIKDANNRFALDLTPAGDIKTILTGSNFQGQEGSRLMAAGLTFIPGGKIASAGKSVAKGAERVIVIGEGMNAVRTTAKTLQSQGINARWYQAWSRNFPTDRLMTPSELNAALARNQRWINTKINQGYKIYDIGIDATRASRSPFYQLEQSILQQRRYPVITIPR